MAEPYGTIAKYRNTLAIKKHNALIQPWASAMALDVAAVFWATWKGIEERLPKGDEVIEAEKPRDSRDLKNKYSAIIRVEVKRHSAEMQHVVENYIYRVWLAGAVEQCRDLGCTGWFLSSLSKSSTSSESASAPDGTSLQEAPRVRNVKADKSGWVSLPNLRAQTYAKKHAAEAVTQINDTTRKEMARIVSDGVKSGSSYNDIAKNIKSKFEEFAVPMPQKHIANRAVLVAVTELANAYCEGNAQVGSYLQDNGVKMMKAWQTLEDDRVSDGCRENEQAGWILFDDKFPSGHMHPPRFPGCRCDFLQDILEEDMLGKPIESLYSRKVEKDTSFPGRHADKSNLRLSEISDHTLQVYDSNGRMEILDDPKYMNMSKSAHDSYLEISQSVKTYEDFEKYLDSMGLELDTPIQTLKSKLYSEDLPEAVKDQVDHIIAALEQYKELGGLPKLKKVVIWDSELDGPQGMYIYNAIGEDDPDAYSIHFRQGNITLHQVMHEFAHAYADSMCPEGYDCVTWSAKLNMLGGLAEDAKAYAGAGKGEYEGTIQAELFADNFSFAFTASGKNYEKNQSFYYSVMDVIKDIQKEGFSESLEISSNLQYMFSESSRESDSCLLKRIGKPKKDVPVNKWDITKLSICRKCIHFSGFTSDAKPYCKAFPERIPDKFWDSKADHTTPYDGDNGMTFEP